MHMFLVPLRFINLNVNNNRKKKIHTDTKRKRRRSSYCSRRTKNQKPIKSFELGDILRYIV